MVFTYRFPGVKKQSISSLLGGFCFAFGIESYGLLTIQSQVRQNVYLASDSSDCVTSWGLSAPLKNQFVCSWLGLQGYIQLAILPAF